MNTIGHATRTCALLLLAIAAGCKQNPTEARSNHETPAAISFTAAIPDVLVQTVVVTVTAPDLPTPRVFSFPVKDGAITGSLTVPAGGNRTVTADAFDAAGIETYRGSTTVTLVPGANPPLTVSMASLSGTVAINVTFGATAIVVTPGVDTLVVRDSVRFQARITDAHGAVVAAAPRWATENPAIASVDSTGMVVSHLRGSVSVFATYDGAVGRSTLVVR